jgi:hypothetical protein
LSETQSSLKKRCCADQKAFHTSLLLLPASDSPSSSLERSSCHSSTAPSYICAPGQRGK